MDSNEALKQFISDLKMKLEIEFEQELPNILSEVESLGKDSRVDVLRKMNDDLEKNKDTMQKEM